MAVGRQTIGPLDTADARLLVTISLSRRHK
jgi:hypothetical protein